MEQYVFEIKLTPRGKHICVARIGLEIVAASRRSYDSSEPAMEDVREQLRQREQKRQSLNVRRLINATS